MKLSKRETHLALATAAAVALLVLDHYVIKPILESGAALEAEEARLVQELEDAGWLFERRRLIAHRWQEQTAGGLASDPAEAESRLLHAMRDWAEEGRLALSSLKPERSPQDGTMREITVLASGTGSMRAVARFLWQVETSSLPLRVVELQLGARKEGTDELSVQLKASTLYLAKVAASEGDVPAGGGGA